MSRSLEESHKAMETANAEVKRLIRELLQHLKDIRPAVSFTGDQFSKLYMAVHHACREIAMSHSFRDYSQLHEAYQEGISYYINQVILPSLKEEVDIVKLIEKYSESLSLSSALPKFIAHSFYHLEQNDRKGISIAERVQPLFRELVTILDDLPQKLCNAVFCLIYQDRQGKQVDWDLVKSSFEVIRNTELDNQLEQNSCMKKLPKEKTSLMEKYTVGLEKPLLADCSSYYSRLATDHVQKYSCSEYMLMAEQCLEKLDKIATSCLPLSLQQKLMEIAQHELLVVQHKHLFEKDDSGLKTLLKCGMAKDLKRMYKLFSHTKEGMSLMISSVIRTFTKNGVELADEKKDFTEGIPRLYCEFVTYIKNYLNDDFRFHKALGNAFEILRREVGCNMTTAEMLAKHAHDILKKGGGIDKQSNSTFEDELDKIAGLVPYINDKNMFAELHRKKLMLRLLYDKNTDIEHENYFILSLKKHNGSVLTSKMERMITDLSLSRKTQRDFKNFLETHQGENADPSVDMAVTILTSGVWPSLKSSALHLPSEMARGAEYFKEFYNSRKIKKKLTWIHTLSTCNLIGHFDKKSIELILTTYQASALMLFNDAERLSFEEIMIQLNLDKDDLVCVLHSLSCSKYKILKKEPSSERVSPADHFKFNSEFTVTMQKIKVPLPRVEDKEVIREVKNKQQYAIAAAITRIMKRRKVLGINELVDECIQQLNHLFEPSFRIIKLQIDSLIDKEYLERDANQPNVFKYVA